MSVSLLPSSLYLHIRSLMSLFVSRSPHSPVGDLRAELSSVMRSFGSAARLFALPLAISQIEHILAVGPPAQQHNTKAIEQFLADELAELQRREPFKWSKQHQTTTSKQQQHTPKTNETQGEETGECKGGVSAPLSPRVFFPPHPIR